MLTEKSYLTLFLSSGFELALALSWTEITLDIIDEKGGFIIKQVETAQAAELFELYDHLYATSYKSCPYRSETIYFDPLFNKTEAVRDRIYKDLKIIEVNNLADRFQM